MTPRIFFVSVLYQSIYFVINNATKLKIRFGWEIVFFIDFDFPILFAKSLISHKICIKRWLDYQI